MVTGMVPSISHEQPSFARDSKKASVRTGTGTKVVRPVGLYNAASAPKTSLFITLSLR